MSLLQDPTKALDQIEWYLDNQNYEKFPGAFELAAGNLCRQTLEQILFILCFFGRVPKSSYLKPNRTLRVASVLIRELAKVDPRTGKTYWVLARERGPRIRKFARYPRVLQKWSRALNEPSHFSTGFRRIDGASIRDFVSRIRPWFDGKDKHLIVAAINELFSSGRVTASLSNDTDNIPGVMSKVVVSPSRLERTEEGGISLRSPLERILVISDLEVPRGRWPGQIVLVQHTVGMSIGVQFVTRQGDPVNIKTMETVLHSFGKTKGRLRYLFARLKQLGFNLEVKRSSTQQSHPGRKPSAPKG